MLTAVTIEAPRCSGKLIGTNNEAAGQGEVDMGGEGEATVPEGVVEEDEVL